MREGDHWRQYLVVTDERVAIVHMRPALLGWNFGRLDIQTGDEWPCMTRDQIVAWKRHHDDGRTCEARLHASERDKVIAYAGL